MDESAKVLTGEKDVIGYAGCIIHAGEFLTHSDARSSTC
jgi:hypothetical protein